MGETCSQTRQKQTEGSDEQCRANPDQGAKPTTEQGAKRHDAGDAESEGSIHLPKKVAWCDGLPDRPGEHRDSGAARTQSKVGAR